MSQQSHEFILKAVDKTKGAFKSLNNSLGKSADQSKKLKKSYEHLFSAAKTGAIALTGIGVAVGAVGAKLVNVAADAEETRNKFNAVFADQVDIANEYVERVSESLGRAKTETMDGLAAFQGFSKGLGFSGEEATKFSTKIHALSLDFASFNNLTDGEAQQLFISALSGSGEVLDRFGINIKQAALDQQLLKMGIEGGTLAASEQEKTMARMAIVMESMGKQGAIGDAVKTSDSFVNTMKRLKGQITKVSEQIGKMLIPIVKPLIKFLADLATKIANMDDKWKKVIAVVIAGTVALAGVGAIILGVTAVIPALTAGIGAIGAVLTALSGPIGWVIGAIGLLFVAYKKNFFGIQDVVHNTIDNTKRFMKLGWKDKLKVVAIGAAGMVKIYIAFQKDIVMGIIKTVKNVIQLWKNMWKITMNIFKNVDFKEMWSGFLESTKKVLTAAWDGIKKWAKDVWASVKNIFKGEDEIAPPEIKMPEMETAAKQKFLDQVTDGLDLDYFENTRKAIADVGSELDDVMTKAGSPRIARLDVDTSTPALADAPSMNLPSLDGGSTDINEFMKGFDMSKFSQAATSGSKKSTDAIKKLTESYKDLYVNARGDLASLETKHAENTSKIKEKIQELNDSLKELEANYKKTMGGFDQSLGNKVVEQEQKIADLKKEIANADKDTNTSDMRKNLKAEEEALKEFLATQEGLDDEIAEARRRKALTEFERFVEDIELKRVAETEEFERKKEQINEELASQQSALEKEKAIYEEKKTAYMQVLDTFEVMVDGVESGNSQMLKNTQMTVDQMKLKLNELKRTLSEIKSLQSASRSSSSSSTPGRANGGFVQAGKEYMVGESGRELFVPNQSGTIVPNHKLEGGGTTVHLTLQIGEVNSRSRVDEIVDAVEKVFTRKMELSQKGIPV